MIIEVILFLLVVYLLFYLFNRKDNLPPGPWSIPYIGLFPLTNVQQCIEMKKKYGKLFMMRFGAYNIVYIFDYQLSKEAFAKLEFVNRPNFDMFQLFQGERDQGITSGIIFSNDTHWHHNRRFLLRHLRDLGMGKSKIEGAIMREVEDLVEDFKLHLDTPSKLPFSLNIAVLNIIWQLISSQRYEFSDMKVRKFLHKLEAIEKYFIRMGIPLFFPFVRYIIPERLLNYLSARDQFVNWSLEFVDIIQPYIDDHLAKLDPDNPVDLMDDYLIEMTVKKSEIYSHFNITDLIKIMFDLFTAGNDTTSNMVRWVLLYMAKFPEVQKKIQENIDEVVNRDSYPRLEHRDKLAYLDSTINEVQRHCSMVAFGLMRGVSTDVTLGGYLIPKDTVVYSVSAMSHLDPTYWENPDEFKPTRFLDENGKFITTCEGFLAFGIGKRQCLGEQFARMELYLILAALLQNFTFSAPDDREIDLSPSDIPTFRSPRKDQKFMIKLRK